MRNKEQEIREWLAQIAQYDRSQEENAINTLEILDNYRKEVLKLQNRVRELESDSNE